ncbi:MAG: VanZ family protein [Bacteroidota bacterium]
MRKLIDWLHENRTVNLSILGIYFLLVVLPHEIVGRFIMNDLLSNFSRSRLNSTVLGISLLAFSTFLFFLFRNLIRGDQKRIKLIYLFITLGLIILVYNTLFVLATESAHFPQYVLLAVILFPLTMSYNDTLFWATLMGAVDEAYQYFYLNPSATGYFDFNDVITDLLGAVLGLLLLWTFGIQGKINAKPWYKRRTFMVGMGILLLAGLLNLLQIITIYPNEDSNGAIITLMNKVPESFWSYDKVGDLYFHVVHPVEGILILCALFGVYSFLGKRDKAF